MIPPRAGYYFLIAFSSRPGGIVLSVVIDADRLKKRRWSVVILHVTVQVKPEHVPEYLEAVRHDAEHSERDEPGCLRFDVIQDREDANRFYYYEAELRGLPSEFSR
jgi:hypothetical protein